MQTAITRNLQRTSKQETAWRGLFSGNVSNSERSAPASTEMIIATDRNQSVSVATTGRELFAKLIPLVDKAWRPDANEIDPSQ